MLTKLSRILGARGSAVAAPSRAKTSLKQLSEDQARQFARRSVSLYALSPASSFKLLAYRENAVFRLDQPGRAPTVLKVLRPGYHSEARLWSDIVWCDALREGGVSTPVSLPNVDGQRLSRLGTIDAAPVFGVLYEWLEGEPPSSSNMVETYRDLGALSARVHKVSQEWTRPDWFERHHWDADGLVGPDPFWGRFLELGDLSAGQRRLFGDAAASVHQALTDWGRGEDRYGLIHADLSPENIFIQGDQTSIIDFDDAGHGWFLFDLATSLSFFLAEDFLPDIRDAWIAGYRREGALPDAHLEALPPLILARLLSALGWVHTRSETATAREMTGALIELAEHVASDFLAKR